MKLSKVKRKVTFLMVECFQNIVRHGESVIFDDEHIENPGYFLTKNIDNTHFITSGNLVRKENVKKLTEDLRHVNSLTKQELRELYKKALSTNEISEKGGAGLGLIELARKSGHPIEFSFKPYNKDYSFFYNQIVMMPEEDKLKYETQELFSLEESIILHTEMNKHNILLIQKGDFSQESILPTLNVIEQNLLENKGLSNKNKEIYHVLVELLQNISKHSLEINNRHEGIVLIGKDESSIFVKAGNYISISQSGNLEKRLRKILSLNKEELRELYLKELQEDDKEDSAGIGLIEIARESIDPIKYNIQLIDAEKMFFTIHVNV
jgi:hypothetical protein